MMRFICVSVLCLRFCVSVSCVSACCVSVFVRFCVSGVCVCVWCCCVSAFPCSCVSSFLCILRLRVSVFPGLAFLCLRSGDFVKQTTFPYARQYISPFAIGFN